MDNKDVIMNDIKNNINNMVNKFNLDIEGKKDRKNDLKKFYIDNLTDNEYVEYEIKKRNKFVEEYPIDKILEFSKEDYCLGLENSKNTFCYKLEYGEYKDTGFGMGGGSSSKCGFYYAGDGKYKGKNNEIVNDVDNYWNDFKKQLHAFLKEMENTEPNFVLDSKYPLLGGSGNYMFLTKLLCLYYPDKFIAMSKDEAYQKLGDYFNKNFNKKAIANSYYANKTFREIIPESNQNHGFYIADAIWKYFYGNKKNMDSYNFEELYELNNKEFAFRAIEILKPYINEDILEILLSDEKSNLYTKHLRAILKKVTGVKSEEELNNISCDGGNRQRYYKEPKIEILGEEYIISNDWYYQTHNDYDNRTPFIDFIKEIVNREQNESVVRVNGGENIIYYGVPGTGKSFEIDKKLKDVSLDNKFRVTFHPEFTYNDFIGQLLPKVDKQTKSITYDFKEGEFTKALKRAYENPGEYVYLVIEEMSRGNCAAIFGDIFQLLDRNQDGDEKDWSTYAVNNELIASRINSRLIHNNMIKIPSNMYIYGTVNTSDQNVFVMDNAFKRRFEWRYISTNPKKDEDKYLNNINIKIYESKENGFDVEWVRLYQMLNMFISSNKYLDLGEDKQIGQFFIKFTEDDGKNFIKLRDKLLHYLWFDVQNASYRNECKLFDSNISNFSTLYDFFDNREKIFSDEFIKILKGEY